MTPDHAYSEYSATWHRRRHGNYCKSGAQNYQVNESSKVREHGHGMIDSPESAAPRNDRRDIQNSSGHSRVSHDDSSDNPAVHANSEIESILSSDQRGNLRRIVPTVPWQEPAEVREGSGGN